jgi:hypothetical protein
MTRSRLYLSAAALLATGGCTTHLETRPDYSTAGFDEAVTGIPYALPALRYKIGVSTSITSCPTVTEFAGLDISDGGFELETTVVPTATYVPGERYVANYAALTSPLKTTGFGIENYPSGVLKSVNVSAEDQSGPLIKDVVSIALSVAGLANRNPLPSFGPSGGLPGATIESVEMNESDKTKLAAAIAKLLSDNMEVAVLCKTDTVADVATATAAKKKAKTDADLLERATKTVVVWTTVNSSRRANRYDLMRLKNALYSQDQAQSIASASKDKFDKARAKISLASEAWWPGIDLNSAPDSDALMLSPAGQTPPSAAAPKPYHLTQAALTNDALVQDARIPDRDAQVLADRVELRKMPIISEDRFHAWWNRLGRDVRQAFIRAYPQVAKHYGVKVIQDFPITSPSDLVVCSDRQSAVACLGDQLSFKGKLTLLDRPVIRPEQAVTTASQAAGGVFVRSAQKADFVLCPWKKPDCAKKDEVGFEAGVSAPQFGQLRFLPFKNRMFEAAELALSMREDGSIEKFEYKRTKAIAGEAAAAVKDAVDQYAAYREKQEKKAQDDLTAQRAEEIASIQHQIDLLNKQKELLKAQAPDTPDPNEAIKNETASIDAQTALLNAKLSQLKAEAALAQASSGGSD